MTEVLYPDPASTTGTFSSPHYRCLPLSLLRGKQIRWHMSGTWQGAGVTPPGLCGVPGTGPQTLTSLGGGEGGGHGCCCTALAAVMVVSLPGPWSGPEASPALPRDTSEMARGLRNSHYRLQTENSPYRGATALPFGFSPSLCIHSCSYYFRWVEGWRVTLSLIDTKQYLP